MTKRLVVGLILLSVVAVPIYADFNALAKAIDAQRGVKKIWIPFLGVARFAVRLVHPEGVRDFQLAVFETKTSLDARAMHALMRQEIGEGFKPLVQVRSRKWGKDKFSFVYSRPAGGNRLELVILAHDDGEDVALVRVEVDAAVIARKMNDPKSVVHVARHEH